ncbi:beta-ketoacyl-ACP synthase II [Bdellovibrio bacteriovorus]|uniref:3-oxoacyl-[acyl-carrier-protein] synthase 2 n=1 Tax=Bdellovibrio bacteriovorus (strain ATCC 15356 / DSM 50701 / NCIMB 9529 / HD100) TaxID=264462 RepID=Q6MLJ9_BDEBA|nr:beta-ketoacyl-ACP synthase II [Bdellovibrio bacteriovorus]AHZ84504.1 3-oxoacyl-ACP synthase [Bdellovibrio bacteriovorus]BEV68393.1 3-oxoacyl-[acyl-carrier-protein] synthase 2 [Bdellovibrio bacteriovorus]CAE79858.1 3-oxoacyl-[acyl-carrier-protein] synthase II [Bdellovibrio bacteriovorus HD100]
MNSRFERPSKPQRRVVVTGVGAVTPLGNTIEDSWAAAIRGQSGIAKITKFDTTGFDVTFAGEVKGFNTDQYVEKKEQKKMDEFIHYSIAASKMAVEMAKLELTEEVKNQAGVIIGVGIGGLANIEETAIKMKERGPGRISPFFIPSVITNLAAGQVTISLGLKGPNYSVTSACASGVHSIGDAVRYIRDGVTDVMLAGGAESTICGLAVGGFASMRALSTRNDAPEKASRPWDKDRDGFVLAEGAAVLCIESLEHAVKRGANILCEITGYGVSSDAYHMTSPAPEGAGGYAAMSMALKDSGLKAEDINYINAHGTSTPVGDGLETAAIKRLLGDHAKKVWVSSTKSMMGHALGAAGAIESAFCVMAIRDQVAPPTINLENPSEDCDLDYVPNEARKGKITNVINNSFGFGGTNASMIFSKYEG